eukprot:1017956-Prymnesium_polylepis.1
MPPRSRNRCGRGLARVKVHDAIAEREELFGAERLREEVGHVVCGRYERHHDLQVLDALADEEVAPCHVLHAGVVLRVVRHCDSRLVVNVKARGLRVAEAQIVQQVAKGYGFLGCFRGCDDLRLTR